MKKIMILAGRYLPGYKDGGPVRTIKNVTDSLGDRYRFSVVCNDRDHGDEEPYPGVKLNDYNLVGNAHVFYVKNGKFSFGQIRKLASSHDLLYVCGPYNTYAIKALILNKLGLIKIPFVLAPMGSFSKGALALKRGKKRLFLNIFKRLGLFNKVYFSVTSEVEEKELREALGINNKCFIAEDMPRKPEDNTSHQACREDGILKVVFLSRICEKKNLSMAIDALLNVKSKVSFSIYGNIEDENYWKKCCKKLEKLPDNITWSYEGELDSENVVKTLAKYDVFLFPTLGENFGHVISEAMSAGCIPVISDTTPWLDLNEKNAGCVIPLYKADNGNKANVEGFTEIISTLCDMDSEKIKVMSDNAVKYALDKYNTAINKNGYMEMFDELI